MGPYTTISRTIIQMHMLHHQVGPIRKASVWLESWLEHVSFGYR